ncbi:hypothetical protein NM208_g13094 [Fusarium decemcellulare]|uniref:Uncharacterized protein n=1 Tax=Fusarium decemcellulare TaxID=57161 RepID=A0ACC1RMH5_9HYPO|nr:hypothetical protein NM208_g13094 [Fusarium decemcellulare]
MGILSARLEQHDLMNGTGGAPTPTDPALDPCEVPLSVGLHFPNSNPRRWTELKERAEARGATETALERHTECILHFADANSSPTRSDTCHAPFSQPESQERACCEDNNLMQAQLDRAGWGELKRCKWGKREDKTREEESENAMSRSEGVGAKHQFIVHVASDEGPWASKPQDDQA